MLLVRIINSYTKMINHFCNKYYSKVFRVCGSNLNLSWPINILGSQAISIGDNFIARKNLKIRAFTQFNSQVFSPQIIVGNNVNIETDCHIGCINQIIIGDNVLIASGVYISDHSHGELDYRDIKIPPIKRNLTSKGPIIIEENVWIGERVVILSGIRIGKFSIIGANAVVTKNVPPYSIVAGVPAKVIRTIKA